MFSWGSVPTERLKTNDLDPDSVSSGDDDYDDVKYDKTVNALPDYI